MWEDDARGGLLCVNEKFCSRTHADAEKLQRRLTRSSPISIPDSRHFFLYAFYFIDAFDIQKHLLEHMYKFISSVSYILY